MPGMIRKYQIYVSAFLFLNFPLSYFVLKIGASPLATMFVNIGIQAALLFVRLYLTKEMIELSIKDFTQKVLLPIIKVSILSLILPSILFYYMSAGWLELIITSVVSLVCSICCVMYMGISKNERENLIRLTVNIIHKIHK